MRERLSKLAWFAGLWLAGVATLSTVAWAIRLALGL
jgi:hypothetical protein